MKLNFFFSLCLFYSIYYGVTINNVFNSLIALFISYVILVCLLVNLNLDFLACFIFLVYIGGVIILFFFLYYLYEFKATVYIVSVNVIFFMGVRVLKQLPI